MEKKDIRVLALDLDGTLTNDQKVVTPATRAALDAAAAKGVTIVLASGRPTAGVMPLAKELGLDKKGGCILSYNGGAIIDCATGETLYRKQLDAKYVPQLCAFAREQGVVIITYNKQGVVTESPEDEWALKECFTCKLPMQKVEDLAAYVDYPICKMLIPLDPARRSGRNPLLLNKGQEGVKGGPYQGVPPLIILENKKLRCVCSGVFVVG